MKNFETTTIQIVDTGMSGGRRARALLAGAHRLLPSAAHAAPLTFPYGI
ncbi:hypothetical protein [Sanguibacter sp. HDW7]|nr:hypothetical protein [Sanguibacter sp. HDW7]QIK84112.1 hypothetical protein G7063_11135 [Sanguibacter sp. HDW7]